ncbi:transketolase C-terminal domain-containing protein [Streptomyces sp. NPDC046909]|uniref:transketolase family protein n=1 Tax=Streptomyces sp. NPDC046909 TaxID=3155617 RepID=UPI0033F08A43
MPEAAVRDTAVHDTAVHETAVHETAVGETPRLSMRPAVADALADLGDRHPELVVMAADGHALGAAFARRHPRRFIDVGIAEANLVGVASGLARDGHRVLVGTMAPFLVRRAAEQIRLDVCRAGLDVTFVGVGGGVAYGMLGATHHTPEDLGAMAAMPMDLVLSPVDAHDAAWAVREAVGHPGPAYVRLGAREDEVVFRGDEPFSSDRPREFGAPDGGTLVLAMGATVPEAVRAAEGATAAGRPTRVLAPAGLAPFPAAEIVRAADAVSAVITVEEHLPHSGLAARTALALAGRWRGRFTALAVDGRRPALVGDRAELFRRHGIDASAVTRAIFDTDRDLE